MKKDYHFLPEPEACRGKHHEDFTKKEAKLMFEWWVGEVPNRTEWLFVMLICTLIFL